MYINGIELRHLRYFLAVAEELNFSRAATRLHMSQPPLSQQIQEMESRLETPLFTRTKRKVELTPAGQTLIPHARKLLRDMEEGLWASKAAAHGQTEKLRIGTIFSAPLVPVFGDIIRRFQNANPATRLTVQELRHTHNLKAIDEDDIDIAFTWFINSAAHKTYETRIVSTDRLHLCLPSEHRLASKKQITIKDLADETLLLTSLQTKMPFFNNLRSLAREASITLRILEESSHFTIIANLVAANIGLGFLPDYVTRLATQPLLHKTIKGVSSKNMQINLAVTYSADNKSAALADFVRQIAVS